VHIANPASSEQEYLRPTLRAGLLAALNLNKAFSDEGLRLFELGKVYLNRNENLPDEPDIAVRRNVRPPRRAVVQGASEPVDSSMPRVLSKACSTRSASRINLKNHQMKTCIL